MKTKFSHLTLICDLRGGRGGGGGPEEEVGASSLEGRASDLSAVTSAEPL